MPLTFQDAEGGYGQSKAVSEYILSRAHEFNGLRATAIRAGQLSGHSEAGAWAKTEWVPSLAQASVKIGMVPNMPIEQQVDWLPVDVASQVVLDVALAPYPVPSVLHLVGSATPIQEVMHLLRVALVNSLDMTLGLCSSHVWCDSLEALADQKSSAAQDIRALRMLGFFQNLMHSNEKCTVPLSRSEMLKVSPALRQTQSFLNLEHVQGWVDWWYAQGLFDDFIN